MVAGMRVLGKGFAAAMVVGGLLPASAGANVTVGNPLTLPTTGGLGAGGAPAKVFVTTGYGAALAPLMSSPVNGTVVQWNVRGSFAVGGPHTLTLRVLQPSGANFIGAGSSTSETIPTVTDDVLRPFSTSIPIRIGDQIGVGATPGSLVPSTSSSGSTFKTYNTFADSSPSGSPIGGGGGLVAAVNAVVAPTNTVALSAITRHKKRGTASLTVTVPNAGTLAISGKSVKPQTRDAHQAGDLSLILQPSRKAAKKLKRTGKSSGKVAFTFTPSFGDPATQQAPVKLLKLRRHPKR
jgi:hypothetical protein